MILSPSCHRVTLRRINIMTVKFWLGFGLIFSIVFNALPIQAQSTGKPLEKSQAIDLSPSLIHDPSEAYRGLMRVGNGPFIRSLAAMTSGEDTATALEAQSIYFLELFQEETKGQFAAVVEKARKYNEKRYEELQKNPAARKAAKPTISMTQRTPVFENIFANQAASRTTKMGGNDVFFINANYSPRPADTPEVRVTETENSRSATASDTKTIEDDTSIVTRTAAVDKNVKFEDNSVAEEQNTAEIVEAASKIDRSKVTKETKMGKSASFGVCPDAAGIVRGKGKSRFYNQTTINTGKQLAAMTIEYITEVQITAHVSDDAVMTHFEMNGTVIEKVFGYDRAYRIGMADNENGFADGTRSITFSSKSNMPPSTSAPDAYRMTRQNPSVIGKTEVTSSGISTNQEVGRIGEMYRTGLSLIMLKLEPMMLSSISRWQHYECVEVKCVSAKNLLKPYEATSVDTVSISKMDLAKINAHLLGKGTQSVAPGYQYGKPNVIFTLTAPEKGVARIIVESVSRRGIGLEVLEIPVDEPKKKPVKPAKPKECDGGWTGTVKAVKTKRQDREEKPSGMLVKSIFSKNETSNIEINVLGTRDTTGGILNKFHGAVNAGYLESDYRESTYSSGRMSCSTGIIESGQIKKYDAQTKGDANGKVLVAISVAGKNGYLSFSSPEISATRITTRTYDSKCPSYNAANSSTDRDDNPITIPGDFFEVEFEVDPGSPNVIKGSKKVQNSDGSETTYTWDLARCS